MITSFKYTILCKKERNNLNNNNRFFLKKPNYCIALQSNIYTRNCVFGAINSYFSARVSS